MSIWWRMTAQTILVIVLQTRQRIVLSEGLTVLKNMLILFRKKLGPPTEPKPHINI